MRKLTLLAAAMLLSFVVGAAHAAVVDESDWTLQNVNKLPINWVMNGNARISLNPEAQGFDPLVTLRLLEARNDQTNSVWHNLRATVPSFTFIADVRITHPNPAACPADGFAMVFADAIPTARGGGGGSLALFGGKNDLKRFTGLEVNLWRDQGLGTAAEKAACPASGKNETFAFDVIASGTAARPAAAPADASVGGGKIGQVNPPARLVNGGAYRYHLNVDGATNTMTLFITGLEANNRSIQKVKVLEATIGIPILNYEGRFGLTAATGGANAQIDVAYTRIEVPAIAP